jgi:hypothetical protein
VSACDDVHHRYKSEQLWLSIRFGRAG